MTSPDRHSPPPPSDHFDGQRFFNPGINTDKSFAELLRWRRTGKPAPWPKWIANESYPPPPLRVAPGQIAVTFIGQATFLIRTAECVMLTDPVFSDRVSPLSFAGPKRVRAPGLALDALPPLDLILLSHNHYDHMDMPSLRRLAARAGRPVPTLTGLGNAAYLDRKGVPGAVERDWWETFDAPPGVSITFVPAQHWSTRSVRDRRRTLWGGFFIRSGTTTIYFAGDSGYCDWFKTIRDRCGAPDLALLPIGAYEPRWFMQSQHMNPAEAVAAHLDLGAGRSVGMHFGTVQLTEEPIDEPVRALARARAAAKIDEEVFRTIGFGETVMFDARPTSGFPVAAEPGPGPG